jgi:predicted aspartyl protease
MDTLKSFLIEKGYSFFKLQKAYSNHFVIKAKINGVKGRFIIDTGASNSCVGLEEIALFKLNLEQTDKKAAGAGSTNIKTQIASQNILKIKRFIIPDLTLVVIDLSHINTALIEHKTNPINGILGADILKEYKGIIDYDYKALYLKTQSEL